jgi:uroporphyrinogen-III synthase
MKIEKIFSPTTRETQDTQKFIARYPSSQLSRAGLYFIVAYKETDARTRERDKRKRHQMSRSSLSSSASSFAATRRVSRASSISSSTKNWKRRIGELRVCASSSSSSGKEDDDASAATTRTSEKKVVVLTRESGKNGQMRKILSQPPFGEDVVSVLEMPLVESVPAEDSEKLRGALETKKFQWIVVTSPEAAKVFTKAWVEAGKPEGLNIGTVGGGTTRALPPREEMKWARLFTPSKALGEVLAEELPLDLDEDSSNDDSSANSNREVLYPCSKKAAKTVENGLSSRGFAVTRLNTYSTEQVTDIPREILEKAVDANVVTFGSPSAVKAWKSLTLELLEERGGRHPTYACIGQTSATACEDCELPDVWHPEDPGMEGWAEVVKLCLEQDESEKWQGIV